MAYQETPKSAHGRSILFVHAHPDDESLNNGATMAKYVAEGAHVALVTCTLGELGEILVPELAHLASDREDRLGEYRVTELANAMRELGVTDHRFLGGPGRYRDSGMMDTPANDDPAAFWQADVDEASALLAEVIREVRPQVLVTYNDFGGYGHPDHIQTHRVAMRAVELAADSEYGGGVPHAVAKVYWNTIPRAVVEAALQSLRESGRDTGFTAAQSLDEIPFAADDSTVTTVIDASAYLARKTAAMRAHATQISVAGSFFALSNGLGMEISGTEYYQLARGTLGGRPPEPDLFAGLER